MHTYNTFKAFIQGAAQSFSTTYCKTLQHSTLPCTTMQHITSHYNTLQHTATYLRKALQNMQKIVPVDYACIRLDEKGSSRRRVTKFTQ